MVAPGALASSQLVQLRNRSVPAIGLDAFTGSYGEADSTAIGDTDNGDFSDPDGVLNLVTIATQVARTDAAASKYYGQAQLTDLVVHFRTKQLLEIKATGGSGVAALDSYAECVPPPIGPYALAYNRTNGAQITVLGRAVPVGTTTLAITGADLDVPTIGASTLTVVVTPHQDPAAQSRRGRRRRGSTSRSPGRSTTPAGARCTRARSRRCGWGGARALRRGAAYAYADTHPDADTNSYAHPDAYAYSDTHADAESDRESDGEHRAEPVPQPYVARPGPAARRWRWRWCAARDRWPGFGSVGGQCAAGRGGCRAGAGWASAAALTGGQAG
ncbi:hypothetical protein ACFQ0T_08065 [Kitasatospora gansuensis]